MRGAIITIIILISTVFVGIDTAVAQTRVAVQPDCIFFYSLSADGSTRAFDNRSAACSVWSASYVSNGFSALTLTVESAPDTSGSPGAWVSFAGTGTAVMTDTAYFSTTLAGYVPWVRVTLSGSADPGTISLVMYGFRSTAGTGGSDITQGTIPWVISGAVTNTPTGNTAVVGPGAAGAAISGNPVRIAGSDGTNTRNMLTDSSGRQSIIGAAATGAAPSGNPMLTAGVGSGATGGLLTLPTFCDTSAAVTVPANTTVELVALTAGRRVRVCSVAISISLTGSAQFVQGTGTNCGTGTANLSGAIALTTGIPLSMSSGSGSIILINTAANALCLSAVTGNITGLISYSQY